MAVSSEQFRTDRRNDQRVEDLRAEVRSIIDAAPFNLSEQAIASLMKFSAIAHPGSGRFEWANA